MFHMLIEEVARARHEERLCGIPSPHRKRRRRRRRQENEPVDPAVRAPVPSTEPDRVRV